jgi:hypothetical protein
MVGLLSPERAVTMAAALPGVKFNNLEQMGWQVVKSPAEHLEEAEDNTPNILATDLLPGGPITAR